MKINYTNEDLLDHHAVSAVIKNSKGEILMQEHVKFGFFTIPIGKAKPRQTPIEGIKEITLHHSDSRKRFGDQPRITAGSMRNTMLKPSVETAPLHSRR